jgi:hypothetical protein
VVVFESILSDLKLKVEVDAAHVLLQSKKASLGYLNRWNSTATPGGFTSLEEAIKEIKDNITQI